MDSNFMTMRRWEQIRHLFSEEEKARLNAAITGEAICPRGIFIDLDNLPPELREKYTLARKESV